MRELRELLYASLQTGIMRDNKLPQTPLRFRLPSRVADASCSLVGIMNATELAAGLTPADFPTVLGVSPISRIWVRNGWLLFNLSDALYTAAVEYAQRTLPFPQEDCNCHVLNRMRCLARNGGSDCPVDGRVQRAWLLTLCCDQSNMALRYAMHALRQLTYHVPIIERSAFRTSCSGVADAAARILYHEIKKDKNTMQNQL